MKLSGFNLGGYLSQTDTFAENHLKNFITAADLKRIRDWGFNCVRLPVDYFFFEDDAKPFEYREDRLIYVDNMVKLCDSLGISVILDLHKAPGHSFAHNERGGNNLWDRTSINRKRFIAIWEMFSKRYCKSNIIYEIMNEPVAPNDSDWDDAAEDAIAAIRKNDREHYIVVESNMWGQCARFGNLKKFSDDKIIYSFHYYEPILITHQMAEWTGFYIHDVYRKFVEYPGRPEGLAGKREELARNDKEEATFLDGQDRYWDLSALEKTMQPVFDFKAKYNVPVLCGEFGIIAKASPATRKNWIHDIMTIFKKHGISFTYWTYKNMDFGINDFTEKYKGNPNYENPGRFDESTLKELRNGIL
jgi:aryl-phospho-beta-D-glucosidase BglC (GH1 family)